MLGSWFYSSNPKAITCAHAPQTLSISQSSPEQQLYVCTMPSHSC